MKSQVIGDIYKTSEGWAFSIATRPDVFSGVFGGYSTRKEAREAFRKQRTQAIVSLNGQRVESQV